MSLNQRHSLQTVQFKNIIPTLHQMVKCETVYSFHLLIYFSELWVHTQCKQNTQMNRLETFLHTLLNNYEHKYVSHIKSSQTSQLFQELHHRYLFSVTSAVSIGTQNPQGSANKQI